MPDVRLFPDQRTTSLQSQNKSPIQGDYDTYAPTYVWARWAVPWVVEPLAQSAGVLPRGAAVLEIGCGTGNYIWALFDVRRELKYVGFDVSEPMLHQARSRDPRLRSFTETPRRGSRFLISHSRLPSRSM